MQKVLFNPRDSINPNKNDSFSVQVSSSVFNVSKVFSNLLLNRGSSPLPTRERRYRTPSSLAPAARSHSTGSSTPASSIKKVFKKRSV